MDLTLGISFWSLKFCNLHVCFYVLALSTELKRVNAFGLFIFLSVCLSASELFNSRKYSLNALKFTHFFHIWCNIDRTENGIHKCNVFSTEIHKSFPIHYCLGGKFLKRVLTYLSCTKYNEINISHSDV